eukprot:TRINITY_DN5663_c0_g1_i1.p1 TRINITY_DN5663_c0_g1~~TRINITY_DN5663_c0_g1_i1.p1  ORF type:complete len:1899 (-),score=642.02 TRINITY_DN5663_c0_g1_i1:50-5119(-)
MIKIVSIGGGPRYELRAVEQSIFSIIGLYQQIINSHYIRYSSITEETSSSPASPISFAAAFSDEENGSSVVHRHFFSNKSFLERMFRLVNLRSPRISRLSLRLLRVVVPVLLPSFVASCDTNSLKKESQEDGLEKSLLDLTGTILTSHLRSFSMENVGELIQLDGYLNWAMASELIQFFRILLKSPTWQPILQDYFQSCILEFDTEEKMRCFAVLSILGGHNEVLRVGGKLESTSSDGEVEKGRILSMNPYSKSGNVSIFSDSLQGLEKEILLDRNSCQISAIPEVPFDASTFNLNLEMMEIFSKILSFNSRISGNEHDLSCDDILMQEFKCVASKSIASFMEQDNGIVEMMKNTNIPSILMNNSLATVESNQIFASTKKSNAGEKALTDLFRLYDFQNISTGSKKIKNDNNENENSIQTNLFTKIVDDELNRINGSELNETFMRESLSLSDNWSYTGFFDGETNGDNIESTHTIELDASSIILGSWVYLHANSPIQTSLTKAGRIFGYSFNGKKTNVSVSFLDEETGIVSKIEASPQYFRTVLDHAKDGIQRGNENLEDGQFVDVKYVLKDLEKSLQSQFIFICRDILCMFFQSSNNDSSSINSLIQFKSIFGNESPIEISKVMRLFVSNHIDLPSMIRFWPCFEIESDPSPKPPQYLLSSKASEFTEGMRQYLHINGNSSDLEGMNSCIEDLNQIRSVISKDLPIAIEKSIMAPCLVVNSNHPTKESVNGDNRGNFIRFSEKGFYLVTFAPKSKVSASFTVYNHTDSDTLHYHSDSGFHSQLFYPFISYHTPLISEGEYEIRITPIGSNIQLCDSLALTQGNFTYVHWLLDVVCRGNMEKAKYFLSRELVLSLFKYCKSQLSMHKHFGFRWLSKIFLHEALSNELLRKEDLKEITYFKNFMFMMFDSGERLDPNKTNFCSPFFTSLLEFVISTESFVEKKSKEDLPPFHMELNQPNPRVEEVQQTEQNNNVEVPQPMEAEPIPPVNFEESMELVIISQDISNIEPKTQEKGWYSDVEWLQKHVEVFLPLNSKSKRDWRVFGGDLSVNPLKKPMVEFVISAKKWETSHPIRLEDSMSEEIQIHFQGAKSVVIFFGDKGSLKAQHSLTFKDADGNVVFDSKTKVTSYDFLEIVGEKCSYQFVVDMNNADHSNVYCDACGNSEMIIGTRWKCLNCPDFDLCTKCYKSIYCTKERHLEHNNCHLFVSSPSQMPPLDVTIPCKVVEIDASKSDHSNYNCARCKDPIRSICRWKCGLCPNFNLCEGCEETHLREEHDPSHIFIRIPFPISDEDDNSVVFPRQQNTYYGITMLIVPDHGDAEAITKRITTVDKNAAEKVAKEMSRWSWEDDVELVRYVTQLGEDPLRMLSIDLPSIEVIHASSSILSKFDRDSIRCRFIALKEFNDYVLNCFPFINLSANEINYWDSETKNMDEVDFSQLPLSSQLLVVKDIIFLEVKLGYFDRIFDDPQMKTYSQQEISLNRGLSISGKEPLFVQAFKQIKTEILAFRGFNQPFRVKFVGEGSHDAGGPFNDAMTTFVSEIQSPSLPLFILCPNGVGEVGFNREKFIPNPQLSSPEDLKMYEFVGVLMGIAFRCRLCLALDLASIFWKKLMDYPVTRNDLKAIDQICCQSLETLSDIEREGITEETFADAISFTYTTTSSDGREIELREGGRNQPVHGGNLCRCNFIHLYNYF